jgi:hypothetical protein
VMGADMMNEWMAGGCKILIATVDTSQPSTKSVLGTNVAVRIMRERVNEGRRAQDARSKGALQATQDLNVIRQNI